jgi:hypothetical protein
VEEPSCAQTEEETTDSLKAGAVGAPDTSVSSVPTNRKMKANTSISCLGRVALREKLDMSAESQNSRTRGDGCR